MSDPIAINDCSYLSGRAVFPGGRWRPTLTLVVWSGTKDGLAVACLCTELAFMPSYQTVGPPVRGGQKLDDRIAGSATELERGLLSCEGNTGSRELRIRRVPLGLVVVANVRSPSRCRFACPGYIIALGYRANGGTCTLFWLSSNYSEETLGLRDGTLGLIEGTPLKGSPRRPWFEFRMGVYRHLLGDPGSIDHFRDLYKVPSNVEVRPDGPEDGLAYRDGWMPFWLVSVVEGGIRFPLHSLVRDCLWEWRLCPCQLLPNGYKIIMGVVRLNQILEIGLGVPDIEDTYDLCKSVEGDTYYLRLRVRRTGFVTALEDSNIFSRKEGAREEELLEGEQCVARAGEKLSRPQLSCCVVSPGVRAPLPVLQHFQKGIGNRLRAEQGRRQLRNSDDRGVRLGGGDRCDSYRTSS
ncbi:hypothetical protein AAC387_Pa06g2452 [Persea americana]